MIDQSRAIKMLGAGISAEMVATTLGCEPSYISQLLSEEHFRDQVLALRTANLTKAAERDNTADEIEDKLLEKLKDSLDLIYKPGDILRAYATINKAVRRGPGAAQGSITNNVTVNLTLPAVVQRKYITDNLGEVVEVDGQTTITMSPTQLLTKLAAEKGDSDAAKSQELLALARRLPSTVLAGK